MRLIDADALWAEIQKEEDVIHDIFDVDANRHFHRMNEIVRIKSIIAYMPPIDAVPVVRCKDCKHLVDEEYCLWSDEPMKENDFCSYGELK